MHDKAIMRAYLSKDMDITELKTAAQKEWEDRGKDAEPDLALMQADIHGERSEQQLGRETLTVSQEALMRATGDTTLTEDTRQILMPSVSNSFLFFRERSRVCHSFRLFGSIPEYVLCS